jgi:hypothetical protein
MAKEAKVGVNTSEAEASFVKLQLQIRKATLELQAAEAAGDKVRFNRAKAQLDELNDTLEVTTLKSLQLDDALAAQPGTLGQLGGAMKAYDSTLKSFLANPVVAILAGIVGAFMALKEALSRTEEGQAKLTKVSEGFTKILNGLFAILEPIANMFIDLVIGLMENDKFMKGLTKTVGVLSGVFGGLFAVIKNVADLIINTLVNNFKTLVNVATGAGKVLKGIFTLDWEAIKEGVADVTNGIKDGFNNTVKNIKNFAVNTVTDVVDGYVAASESAEKSFTEGSKRLTDKEKKDKEERDKRNADAAAKAKKLAQDAINTNEQVQQSNDELAESQRKKSEEIIQALKDEQAYKDKEYAREQKRITDLMALEVVGSNEYKALLAQKTDLETKYNNDKTARNTKLTEEEKKKAEEDKKLAEETAKALTITEEQKYKKALAESDAYYDELIKKNKDNAEVVAQLEKAKGEKALEITNDYNEKVYNAKKEALEKEQGLIVGDIERGLATMQEARIRDFDGEKAFLDKKATEMNASFAAQLAAAQGNADEEKRIQTAQTEFNGKIAETNKAIDADQYGFKQQQLSEVGNSVGQLSQLIGQDTIAGKALGIAQATINTYQGATEALKQKSTLPSPFDTIAKVINVATILATGFKAVKSITSVQVPSVPAAGGAAGAAPQGSKFAKGGILVGPSHSEGGIKSAYGELEGGEFVVNKRSTRSFLPMLNAINSAGNRKYANGGMTPSMSDLQEIMAQQTTPVVKTYVVASEMSSAMEANKKIGDLARL